MMRYLFKRTTAAIISAAVAFGLCSCHERLLTDESDRAELSFSWWGGDDRNKRTLNGLNEFTEQTGITVRPIYEEFTGFKAKMDVQIYSDTEADVMQLNYDWLYQYTGQGEEFYDLSQLSGVDLSTYPEGSLDFGMVDGKLQAIPYGFNALTFLYNKTLLDSYGIEPPSTWEELFEAAKLTRRDGVYILSLTEKHFWMISCAYLEQVTGHKAFDNKEQLILTEEDIVIMLNFCERLLDEKVSPIGSDYDRRDLALLRMAGTVSWASDSGYYEDAAKEISMELAIGPYITEDNYVGYGWYEKPTGLYAVRKDTKSPENAGKLVDHLINSADMATSLGMSKGVPVSSAAAEALEARGLLKGVEFESNRMMRDEYRLGTMSPSLENEELIAIFADAVNSIYYGSADVGTVASTALASMNEVVL